MTERSDNTSEASCDFVNTFIIGILCVAVMWAAIMIAALGLPNCVPGPALDVVHVRRVR